MIGDQTTALQPATDDHRQPEGDIINWLRYLVQQNTGRGQAIISQVLVKDIGTSWKYAYFEEAGRRDATWGFGDVTLGEKYDHDADTAHSVDELMELYPNALLVESFPDETGSYVPDLEEDLEEEFKTQMVGKDILLASCFIDVTDRVIIA